jgi:hypothetical protein
MTPYLPAKTKQAMHSILQIDFGRREDRVLLELDLDDVLKDCDDLGCAE